MLRKINTNKKQKFPLVDDELKSKVFVTLSLLVLIRLGTFIPVPGIDQESLSISLKNSPIASFLSTFSDRKTFIIGLFTLNIFPYINASILMQILVSTFPKLQKLQKEGGLAGRQEITQLTRLLSLGWALFQSTTIAFFLKGILFGWDFNLALQIVAYLTSGAMIVMWFSELITEYGVGNGASLLIFTNIVSNLPNLVKSVFSDQTAALTIPTKVLISTIVVIAISGIIYLQEGVRMIPLISSKELLSSSKVGGNFIPLRLNQAGVMPIIFTATLLVLPAYLIKSAGLPIIKFLFLNKILYWVSYFSLVLGFSYFYSTIILNPKDISNELRKMAVTVPGTRPGSQTTFFLKNEMKRITFIGATFLAIITTLPNILEIILNVQTLKGLGTTSLLILVGVIIDTTREIRSIVLSNIYKNRIKSQ
jgi:preprotein translocase subunit SecY